REVFGAVSTVDLGGVGVITAFEQIGSITRIPDHAVVTGFTENLIVAAAAEELVVAALAKQGVIATLDEKKVRAGAAGERIVAGAAEKMRRGQRAIGLVERNRIVATLTKNVDLSRIRDCRLATNGSNRSAIDQDLPCSIAACRDGVFSGVAKHGQQAGAGNESGFDCHGRWSSKFGGTWAAVGFARSRWIDPA